MKLPYEVQYEYYQEIPHQSVLTSTEGWSVEQEDNTCKLHN